MGTGLGAVARSLLVVLLEYVRWTQFVPMLLAWGFLLFMLAAMALVSFQEPAFTALEWVGSQLAPWMERLRGSGLLPSLPETDADGVLRLETGDFRRLILWGWTVLGLILLVLGLLRQWLFGAPRRSSFGRKVLWLLLWGLLVFTGFGAVYLFGTEPFHGSPVGWFAMFLLGPLAAVLISLYSLGISAVVTALEDRLEAGPEHGAAMHRNGR